MSDALNLWFFRDLNDDQRLKLFGLFGLPIDEIGAHHGRQSVALKQVMQSLIKMVNKEVSPAPQTQMLRSVQSSPAGLNVVEEGRKTNSDVSREQHHRQTANSVSQASILLDDTPAVIRLSDSQVPFGAARYFHEPPNSDLHKELHVAHQLVATAQPFPKPSSLVKALEHQIEAAREFVKRHPALTLVDLAEFEAFLKVPAMMEAALATEGKDNG